LKIVIVIPPLEDFYFTHKRAAPLGAEILKRELGETGNRVRIINFPVISRPRKIQLPQELLYLERYMIRNETGPVSGFTSYNHFGPQLKNAAEIIASERADLVLFSNFAWTYARTAVELAMLTAELVPDTPFAIGGHGPSAIPGYFIKARHPVYPEKPLFTTVAAGEAEGRTGILVDAVREKEGFIDFRKFEIVKNPRPVSSAVYLSGKFKGISVLLSRGCPLKCSFCSNHITHGRVFRTSSVTEWENEIKQAVEKQIQAFADLKDSEKVEKSGQGSGPLHGRKPENRPDKRPILINIEDDNILFYKKDFINMLLSVKAAYPQAMFTAENGLDYMLLETSDIKDLEKAGFVSLNFSLAVLDKKALQSVSRRGDKDRLANLTETAAELNMPVTVHFISGLENDSAADTVNTLLYIDSLPAAMSGISPFYPVPGLPGFSDNSVFMDSNPALSAGSSFFPWNKTLTTQQMITAFRLSRWSNFRKRHEKSGKDSATEIEKQLYSTTIREKRIYTIIKRNNNKELAAPGFTDKTMTEEFFSAALQRNHSDIQP